MENEPSSSCSVMGMSHSFGQGSSDPCSKRDKNLSRADDTEENCEVKKMKKQIMKSKKDQKKHKEMNLATENSIKESKKVRFTEEEDEEMVRLIKLHGKKWRLISELMNGKNETRIRNRYYSRLREVLKEPGVNGNEENDDESAENERESQVKEDTYEDFQCDKAYKNQKPQQEQQERQFFYNQDLNQNVPVQPILTLNASQTENSYGRSKISIERENKHNEDVKYQENLKFEQTHQPPNIGGVFQSLNQFPSLLDIDKRYPQFDELSPLPKQHHPAHRLHIGSLNHFPYESSPIYQKQDHFCQTPLNNENSKYFLQLHSVPYLDKNLSFSQQQDIFIEENHLQKNYDVPPAASQNHTHIQEHTQQQPDKLIDNTLAFPRRNDSNIPDIFRPNEYLEKIPNNGLLDEPSPLIFKNKQFHKDNKSYDQIQEDKQISSFNGELDEEGYQNIKSSNLCQEEEEVKQQNIQQNQQKQYHMSNYEKIQKIQFLNKQVIYISQMLEQCRIQITKELMNKQQQALNHV